MTPEVAAGWREHFRRFPFDGAERVLSMIFSLQCADPKPEDWQVRPWAYSPEQLAALTAEKEEAADAQAEASAQRALARIMGG